MYDIEHLEEEWKRYKSKKRRPYIILIGLLTLGSLGLFYFTGSRKNNLSNNPIVLSNVTSTKVEKKVKIITKETSLLLANSISILEENKIIQPLIPKVQRSNPIPIPQKKLKSKRIRKEIKHYKAKIKKINKKSVVKRSRKKRKVNKVPKKKTLNILETTSVDAYAEVAERFKHLRDPHDSLFLAKNYYKHGNYKKAAQWALLTNRVDSKIEDSWLIFAKSKLKLGRKNEAIQILQNYIKRSDSNTARRILYKIK